MLLFGRGNLHLTANEPQEEEKHLVKKTDTKEHSDNEVKQNDRRDIREINEH